MSVEHVVHVAETHFGVHELYLVPFFFVVLAVNSFELPVTDGALLLLLLQVDAPDQALQSGGLFRGHVVDHESCDHVEVHLP